MKPSLDKWKKYVLIVNILKQLMSLDYRDNIISMALQLSIKRNLHANNRWIHYLDNLARFAAFLIFTLSSIENFYGLLTP